LTAFTLFAAPGTCARVTCIALEETGADYAIQLVRFMKGEHRKPEFLTLNPAGKVPTLLVDGEPLTENPAIGLYLAGKFPDAGLLPLQGEPLNDARVTADLSYCSSTLHPIVSRIRLPDFVVEGETAIASVRAKAIEAMHFHAALISERVGDGRWWYGTDWSLVDAYVYWVWFRITGAGFPAEAFPAWADHARRLEERPAVQRALKREAAMQATLEKEGLTFRPR